MQEVNLTFLTSGEDKEGRGGGWRKHDQSIAANRKMRETLCSNFLKYLGPGNTEIY